MSRPRDSGSGSFCWSLTEQGRFIRRMVAEHGPRHGMDRVKQFAAQAGVVVNDSGAVIKRPPLDR